jgi:hypothetical protein
MKLAKIHAAAMLTAMQFAFGKASSLHFSNIRTKR